MKTIIASLLVLCFANVSWAIEKNDPMTSIGTGSTFTVAKDITILANSKETKLFMTVVDNRWLTCNLYTDSATTERLLKAGTQLTVNRTEKIRDGFFHKDGASAVVLFDSSAIVALKCFTGEPLGDNYKVPSFGLMETGLAEYFTVSPAAADEIP